MVQSYCNKVAAIGAAADGKAEKVMPNTIDEVKQDAAEQDEENGGERLSLDASGNVLIANKPYGEKEDGSTIRYTVRVVKPESFNSEHFIHLCNAAALYVHQRRSKADYMGGLAKGDVKADGATFDITAEHLAALADNARGGGEGLAEEYGIAAARIRQAKKAAGATPDELKKMTSRTVRKLENEGNKQVAALLTKIRKELEKQSVDESLAAL